MVFIEFIFFLFFFDFLNARRAYLLNTLEWFVLLPESFLFLVGFLWWILAMCLPLQFGFVLWLVLSVLILLLGTVLWHVPLLIAVETSAFFLEAIFVCFSVGSSCSRVSVILSGMSDLCEYLLIHVHGDWNVIGVTSVNGVVRSGPLIFDGCGILECKSTFVFLQLGFSSVYPFIKCGGLSIPVQDCVHELWIWDQVRIGEQFQLQRGHILLERLNVWMWRYKNPIRLLSWLAVVKLHERSVV